MKKFKIILDIIMTIIILVLMNIDITGLKIHEILGIFIFIIFIIHKGLNFKWIKCTTKNILKNTLSNKVKFMYFIDILLFIIITLNVITGILISKELFDININSSINLTILHHFFAYWSIIIISVHVGLHWKIILNKINQLLKVSKDDVIIKVVYKALYIAIAFVGIISIFKTNIYKNIFNPINNKSSNKEESSKQKDDSTNTSSNNIYISDNTSLEGYLDKLYCTGCGKRCPLTSPQCMVGMNQQKEKIQEYNEVYNKDETYTVTESDNQGLNVKEEKSENLKNFDSNSKPNIFNYFTIMGFLIGGTYYISKIKKK